MSDSNVGELFLTEQRRRVQKDRTVTLDGVAFEVDAALVGDHVLLRYDPARKPDKRTVEVWRQGRRVEVAKRVDVLANCFVKRNNVAQQLHLSDADVHTPRRGGEEKSEGEVGSRMGCVGGSNFAQVEIGNLDNANGPGTNRPFMPPTIPDRRARPADVRSKGTSTESVQDQAPNSVHERE